MPEMEKENLIDPGNGPKSPSVAHSITDTMVSSEKVNQLASSPPEKKNNTEDSDNNKEMSYDCTKGSTDLEYHRSPSPIRRRRSVVDSDDDDDQSRDSNSRSSVREESQTMDNWNRHHSIQRPQTAPLCVDEENDDQIGHMDKSEQRTKSVPLSYEESPTQMILQRVLSSGQGNETTTTIDKILAWHPHVYANPPKKPTPHSISDILGLSRTRLDSDSAQVVVEESSSRQSFHHHHHRMGSSTSMSDSSDSEEQSMQFRPEGGDQPLNLCLSKTRSDSSPAAETRNGRGGTASKKGECNKSFDKTV